MLERKGRGPSGNGALRSLLASCQIHTNLATGAQLEDQGEDGEDPRERAGS